MANKNINTKLKVNFSEASSRTNIISGENISTSFGKIKKFFSDLKTVAFTGSYNDLTDKPTISSNSDFQYYTDTYYTIYKITFKQTTYNYFILTYCINDFSAYATALDIVSGNQKNGYYTTTRGSTNEITINNKTITRYFPSDSLSIKTLYIPSATMSKISKIELGNANSGGQETYTTIYTSS